MPLVTRTLDLSTRYFWRLVGRRVAIAGADRWLDSPTNAIEARGDNWLDVLDAAGRVRAPDPGDGLLATFAALDGPDFSSANVDEKVRDFYEHTASWRMEVWSQWNTLFAPGGELIARMWGRRVEQLALPVEPLSVSRGMASSVRIVDDTTGDRAGAAWLRTLKSDGSNVYSGFYRVSQLPGIDQPHVHVSFPLESGSVQVFLTPRADNDGSFWLHSRSESFGADGAYAVVRFGDDWYAAQPPLRETFHVFADEDGVLRTDHWLKLGRWRALQLHYRLERD
ncbi:hypothetical protein ACIA48_05410 [Mycobacterium sp. NPDC051804]|uniref:hypothetical protein n=1 Tax=Mycobacterium sp. NPDC051804 TaxID=3364295 RepID=UPI0037B7E831